MGVIRDDDGRERTLSPRTLIGRSRSCAIRPESSLVSGEHACVLWTGGQWSVRDLGSTNGTWVDGRRLEAGERTTIGVGARIALGGGGPHFELVAAETPRVRAVDLDGGDRLEGALDHLQAPEADESRWTVFDDGARWVLDRDGIAETIDDQHVLEHSGKRWRLLLPARITGEVLDTTDADGLGPTPLDVCALRFLVSSDEEQVNVTLRGRGREHELTPRSFHYTILTLARKRLEDRGLGLPSGEEGWLYADDLARKLGATKPKLNLDVCRMRQQFADLGIVGGGRIVERRATSQQIRIGVVELEVVRAAATG